MIREVWSLGSLWAGFRRVAWVCLFMKPFHLLHICSASFRLDNCSCMTEVYKPRSLGQKREEVSLLFALRDIRHKLLMQRSGNFSRVRAMKPVLVCVWRPGPLHRGLLNSGCVSSRGSPSTDWVLRSSARCCTVCSFIITDKFLLIQFVEWLFYVSVRVCMCGFVLFLLFSDDKTAFH